MSIGLVIIRSVPSPSRRAMRFGMPTRAIGAAAGPEASSNYSRSGKLMNADAEKGKNRRTQGARARRFVLAGRFPLGAHVLPGLACRLGTAASLRRACARHGRDGQHRSPWTSRWAKRPGAHDGVLALGSLAEQVDQRFASWTTISSDMAMRCRAGTTPRRLGAGTPAASNRKGSPPAARIQVSLAAAWNDSATLRDLPTRLR